VQIPHSHEVTGAAAGAEDAGTTSMSLSGSVSDSVSVLGAGPAGTESASCTGKSDGTSTFR
jgi:hypothetical protein